MCGESDKPTFRFHPGAYEVGRSFEETDDCCEVCGQPCVWRYTGQIYTANAQPDAVCARCVANGALVEWLDAPTAQLHDAVLEGKVSPDLGVEALERTPGFATYNAFTWPVVENQPLAFIGYGDSADTWADPSVKQVMKETWLREFGEELEGPTAYLLVFRSLDGNDCCAVVDHG